MHKLKRLSNFENNVKQEWKKQAWNYKNQNENEWVGGAEKHTILPHNNAPWQNANECISNATQLFPNTCLFILSRCFKDENKQAQPSVHFIVWDSFEKLMEPVLFYSTPFHSHPIQSLSIKSNMGILFPLILSARLFHSATSNYLVFCHIFLLFLHIFR